MKKLTDKELEEAPHIIQFIYICCLQNIPIGMSMYEEALKKYPEYFTSKSK